MKNYIIRAALHEEANEGWMWMDELPSRTLVKVTNRGNNRSVICQVRKFDENFLKKYNDRPTICIPIESKKRKPTIVMGQWYRDALGGFDTTDEDNNSRQAYLDVKNVLWISLPWATLRAAAGHHPDTVVRLGTRLGVLGAYLGMLGLLSLFVEPFQFYTYSKWIIPVVALAALGVGLRACWPPKAPEEQ